MPVVVIGLSHHTAPVTLRERFAFADARVPEILQTLCNSSAADEAVILSTCNRVEIYAATSLDERSAFAKLQALLASVHDYHEPLSDEIYMLGEPQSLHHLFKVRSEERRVGKECRSRRAADNE